MFTSGDLYWHEGLFLQPHHLQKMQRSITEQFQHEHEQIKNNSYGLISIDLNTTKLKEGILEFNELKAYMPSGVYIDIKNNAILKSFNIKTQSQSLPFPVIVYMGIPIWSNNQPNTTTGESNWQSDRLYNIEEINWNDEDTCDNPTTILLRKIKVRLFLGNKNSDGYELMPIIKLETTSSNSENTDSNIINLDKDFIPPYYTISESAILQRFFNDIIYKIRTSAKELDKTTKNSELFHDNPEKLIKPLMQLSILNSNGMELSQLINQKNITPFELYLKLASFVADLSTFMPDVDSFSLIPIYNHEDMNSCLNKLKLAIDKLLSYPVYTQQYKKEKFIPIDKNLYELELEPNSINSTNEYYLGIVTHRTSSDIISIIEQGDSFKLLPPSLKRGKAIPGIKLEHQNIPPTGFPKHLGLYYFRLTFTNDDFIWEQIVTENKMDIPLADETSKLIKEIDLYIQQGGR